MPVFHIGEWMETIGCLKVGKGILPLYPLRDNAGVEFWNQSAFELQQATINTDFMFSVSVISIDGKPVALLKAGQKVHMIWSLGAKTSKKNPNPGMFL